MLTTESALGHDFAHDSRVLGRRKLAHVVPPTKQRGPQCPLFVMLHSFAGNRLSWINNAPDVVAALARDFLVVFPECGRKWFIDDCSGARYEDYLIRELIPLVQAEYQTGPASIGGFSMGGAAAFFLAFRHPDMFVSALAVAGAFFAGDREGDPYRAVRSDGLMMPSVEEHERVWGPPGSSVRATYDPAALIGQLNPRSRLPRFYFEVGTDDYGRVLEASERMRGLLENAGIAFEFSRQSGDHSWAYAAAGMTRLIEKLRASPLTC